MRTPVWSIFAAPIAKMTRWLGCKTQHTNNWLFILPDSAVLTLRKERPSADSCGDPFLEKPIDGLLPVGCGAEAVFNFSWEKQIAEYGSGDDDDDDDYQWPTTEGTIIIPTRALLSTPAHHRTTRATTAARMGIVSIHPNRSATRHPPRFTPSPESRHSAFQHLLRLHLNTFNQRLSMLEKNTLDMKESIHSMEDQQIHLSSQLKELIAVQSAGEKNKKVNELEKSYTDMEARLSRLEGRLEILIDGFTALAQEMNKMKRSKHSSRSLQEKRALPSIATVLERPSYSTSQPPVRTIPTETPMTSRATVPKSIPTPGLPAKKPTTAPRRGRKLKSGGGTTSAKNTTKSQSVTRSSKRQVSTSTATKLKTTVNKPRTTSKSKSRATAKPETKRPGGRRSTVAAKRVSRPSNTKPNQAKKEATITKFQVEPPSHKPNLAKADQAKKKGSSSPVKNNGRNKAFRSDAPVSTKVQEDGESLEGDSKKSSKTQKTHSNQNEKKIERNSSVSHKTKNSSKTTVTTTKPTKTTRTVKRKTTPTKTKATAATKKSNTTVKRKSTPPKTKATTAKKVTKKTQQRKKTSSRSGVLDLLQLLKRDHKSAKQKKSQDGSLHVVLGRLAIPIKIIPDY